MDSKTADRPQHLVDVATELADLGWHTFPVKNKRPLGKWRDISTTDPETLNWTGATHVAIDCGKSGLAVVDYDPGSTRLDWPETMTQRTPRGEHHIYRANGHDVRNSAGLLGDHIDVRGDGGFIVWYENADMFDDLAEWPAPVRKSPDMRDDPFTVSGGIPEGSRNDTLFHQGLGFISRNANATAQELLTELRNVNQEECVPPLDDGEVQQIGLQVWRSNIRGKAQLETAAEAPKKAARRAKLISSTQLAEKEFRPLREFVSGWIVPGFNILAGPPKRGKSFLLVQTCMAIATGADVIGRTTDQARVLYMALEDSERRLRDRMDMWTDESGVLAHDGLSFLTGQVDLKTELNAYWDQFDVFVIDTGTRALETGSGEYHEVSRALGEFQTQAINDDKALIFVWHTRKDTRNSDGKIVDVGFEAILGSQGITGVADAMAILKPGELEVTGRDVSAEKQPLENRDAFWFAHEDRPTVYTAKEEILAALEGGQFHRQSDIVRACKASRATVKRALNDMIKDGLLVHRSGGYKIK